MRRRLAVAGVGAALILAACGGSDSTSTSATTPIADTDDAVTPDGSDGAENPDAPAPAPSGPGLVDLVGPDVVSSAEIETNLLPSVVLDDVTTGEKVNFRNLVPQEKPILLWMYAPH